MAGEIITKKMKIKDKIRTTTKSEIKKNKFSAKDKLISESKFKNKSENKFDSYKIIQFPLSTEKSIQQIEFDNKLSFVVGPKATKADIKKAVEELFKVKVSQVNIQNSFRGEKRAYVKLSKKYSASDLSADLGLI